LAESPVGITELLRRWQTGDAEAESRLFEVLMPELHDIAVRCFRKERPGRRPWSTRRSSAWPGRRTAAAAGRPPRAVALRATHGGDDMTALLDRDDRVMSLMAADAAL